MIRDLIVVLLFPLGSALALVLVACIAGLSGWRRLSFGTGSVGLVWLYLWSMPLFSGWVIGHYEQQWPLLSAQQSPEGDVIVVLGGAFFKAEAWPSADANSAVDRYWHAARLFQAGKAPLIIVSGGHSRNRPAAVAEAESGFEFLRNLGVPAASIILESEATTTRENALKVKELLNHQALERVLLVTSAMHMRRSIAAFGSIGVPVIPVSTDPTWGGSDRFDVRSVLPSASALSDSTRLFHELIGLWYYRFRGWA